MPAISQHLSRLRAGALVESRRDGVRLYYSLHAESADHIRQLVTSVFELAEHLLYPNPPHHH